MKTVGFGEIMLRLTPPGYMRFAQTESFEASFGGSEANVILSLSQLGEETAFVTKLPENEIADACIRELRGFGVNTDFIARGGKRMGLYFLEKGASLRSGKVIYDREGSSISQAELADFDWEKIFDGADVFHYTGITPALSDSLAEILLSALKAAKKKNVTVSCDLNYRSKLWSKEKAKTVMSELMPYTDWLIANDGSAYDVFGIGSEAYGDGKFAQEAYTEIAGKLTAAFGFKAVALTCRESISASDNNYSGMLYKDGKSYFSSIYPVHIVDRVGGGDAFAAGLIYGMNNYENPEDAIGFAAAAGALKHTVEGDFNIASKDEIEALMHGNTNGIVRR